MILFGSICRQQWNNQQADEKRARGKPERFPFGMQTDEEEKNEGEKDAGEEDDGAKIDGENGGIVQEASTEEEREEIDQG